MPRNKSTEANRQQTNFTVHDEIKRDRRMRQARNIKRARNQQRSVFAVLLCVTVFALIIFAILTLAMRVQTVQIDGSRRYSPEEIASAADIGGAILPFVSADKVEEKIRMSCPYVDNITLVKKYPSEVYIAVTETRAVYSLHVLGEYYSLDASLRVVDKDPVDVNLTELVLPTTKTTVVGREIEFSEAGKMTIIREVLEALSDYREDLRITKMDLSNNFHIYVYSDDRVKFYLGDYKNVGKKIEYAKSVLDSPQFASSERTYIDVSKLGGASVIPHYDGDF